MSSSKITIAGAEKWFNDHDSSLFAESTFPAGVSKDLIIDAVIMRGGEFEVLYSDLDFMQAATTRWAQRWNRTFTKWYEALQIEYDPLYNYDRTEEWTTTDEGTENRETAQTERMTRQLTEDITHSLTSEETRDLDSTENRDLEKVRTQTTLTEQDGSSTDTGSGTSTDTVSAYNSSTYQPDKQNNSTSTGSTTTTAETNETVSENIADSGTISGNESGTISKVDSGADNTTYGGSQDTTGSETNDIEHQNTNIRHGRAFGNIGITSSQQMLTEELNIVQWNLYEHIADIYLQEFAIPIY